MHYDVYAALGNEMRVKLLLCLGQKPKNVSELIANCGLAQSAVSQHLLKLKKAKLVSTTKKGKEIIYALNHKKALTIGKLLLSLKKEVL